MKDTLILKPDSTNPSRIIRWQDGTLRSVIIKGELTEENILTQIRELEERKGKKCVAII